MQTKYFTNVIEGDKKAPSPNRVYLASCLQHFAQIPPSAELQIRSERYMTLRRALEN